MATLDTDFERATLEIEKINEKLGQTQLLALYGYYKIANDADISKAPKGGLFSPTDKAKYDTWKAKLDKKFTPDMAKEAYVILVDSYKKTYGFDASRTTKSDGSAISPANLKKLEELPEQKAKYSLGSPEELEK